MLVLGVPVALLFQLPSGFGRFSGRTAAVGLFATALLACAATEPKRPSTWMALAAERWYTCGLSPSGEAFCWGGTSGGFRDDPPIWDSLPPNSAVPLRVPGGRRFVQITVGETVTCAIDSLRAGYCWGRNEKGDVGDGSRISKRAPSAVLGGFRWKTLAAGSSRACGVTIEGKAYCWGNQFRGALGNGVYSFDPRPTPSAVLGGLTFVTISYGVATGCALTPEGDAYCWGVNDNGMLGDGNPPEPFKESTTPVRVAGGLRFTSLSVGASNVCAVTADNSAYCWGYGVLGNGSAEPSSTPLPVSGDLRWKSLSVGGGHTCGLTTDGAAYCWGNGQRGRFGTGDTSIALTPRLIAPAGKYVAIVAGGEHTCGLTGSGTAFCWGRGDYGQLGDGLFADRLRPVQVAPTATQ